jgi:molybdate transport system substrate-binding protein
MSMPATIRVFSGGATQGAFAALTPAFEAKVRCKVDYVFEVTAALDRRLARGEVADVLVLPVPALDGYEKADKVRGDARAVFGNLAVAVAVKEGTRKPDISTKEKFREAMLAARSIVYATPGKTPSGTHLGKVMAELAIAKATAGKTIHKPALDGGIEVVANGQAEIGIYPASEVAMVKGLDVVGPLPPGIDLTIVYGGAVMTGSGEAAAQFLRFMAAPENRTAWIAAGFTPV